jgi:hypothetical protein
MTERAEAMDDDLGAIQARLRGLRERLDAFEPWDHKASAARLHAIDVESEQRQAQVPRDEV